MDDARILQEQEELLRRGYYLFRIAGNRIFYLSSKKTWEGYAPFSTPEEARIGLDAIIELYPECLECELDPWRVMWRPEQKRVAV